MELIVAILAVLHLSPARYHAWRRAEVRCELTDRSSCPRTSPTQLTAKEIGTIHEMVTSSDYRHTSLSCLAVFAQREGRVFAAPSTWSKLTREREWLCPRRRVHPASAAGFLRQNSSGVKRHYPKLPVLQNQQYGWLSFEAVSAV